jgi:DNA-binding NtrC family response regulator
MSRAEIEQMLVGTSPEISRVRELIARVAQSNLSILILGPTGVGKDLVAQAIHRESGRRGAYVAFNVCAIPDAIFESALFGHRRGAFTGAHGDVPGLLAEGHRGTVFLDEIGALSVPSQVKLLRAIERQSFRPLGTTAEIASDFRMVAASNTNLFQLAERGEFRADLVQRLAGVTITVPALTNRVADIRPLVERFLRETTGRLGTPVTFTESALRLLEEYPWPGNVRELRLTVERAAVLTDTPRIAREQLAGMLNGWLLSRDNGHCIDASAREAMVRVLDQEQWNTAAVAARLGMHRATVYRRMERLGIETPSLRLVGKPVS